MGNEEIMTEGTKQAVYEVQYIVDWCKSNNISQKKLCELAGASPAILSHWDKEVPRTLEIFFSLHKAMEQIDNSKA